MKEREYGEKEVPAEWNELTRRIIGAAMEVHSRLGPGGLEKMYERALIVELRHCGLTVKQQVAANVTYREQPIGELVIDLVVNDLIVLELKAVEAVADVHLAQLVSYLRHGDYPLGLLINFNVLHLREGVSRRINSRSSRFPSPSAPSA